MKNSVLFLMLVTVVVSGCSGITVSQDYAKDVNLRDLQSFRWKLDPESKQGDDSELSPLVANRIRAAIERELQAKGIAYDSDVPDFLIDYNLTVESKITSSNVGTTVGFGTGGYGHIGGVVVSTAPDIRQYDEGTIYIDFYSANDDALVWRGISSQVIDKHDAPERVTEQINLNVQKILEQFPPQ
jgi:hypothetical protein